MRIGTTRLEPIRRHAFTGAVGSRRGRFLLANGETIFLDEIGTMGADLQATLLRVLQEREIDPLGGERTVPIDVRVIAASNRDLRQLVTAGPLQADLFYRLNVIPIALPPLRERPDDIPLLVGHFVVKHAAQSGKRIDALYLAKHPHIDVARSSRDRVTS